MTYCALRFGVWLVLPKCWAALTASLPSWVALALPGAAALLSNQTPPSVLAVGCWMWMPADPQVVVPFGTPSQYWFMMVPQLSAVPNRPLKRFCRSVAAPAGSFDHWEPQKTRYTFRCGDTTPVLALEPTARVLPLRAGKAVGCTGLTPCRAGSAADGADRSAACASGTVPKAARTAMAATRDGRKDTAIPPATLNTLIAIDGDGHARGAGPR